MRIVSYRVYRVSTQTIGGGVKKKKGGRTDHGRGRAVAEEAVRPVDELGGQLRQLRRKVVGTDEKVVQSQTVVVALDRLSVVPVP